MRPTVKMGNKQLATPSVIITTFSTPELNELIADMQDTMNQMGGVGIAAPQIGVNLRVVIFGFEKSERYPNEAPIPFTVLINPTIDVVSKDMVDGWEGCLSVPKMRGLVPRYKTIRYNGYDLNGIEFSREVSGFHARIVQHECDHLDGILFPQRIKDLRNFGFEEELQENALDQLPD